MSLAKLRVLESLGSSPFPDFARPTPEQCHAANSVLVKKHGSRIRPAQFNKPEFGEKCGEVPSVLEVLVRMILYQNSTNKNSSLAEKSLDRRFGQGNNEAIREAALEDVVEAPRWRGLANIKGGRIKAILEEVQEKHGKLRLDHLDTIGDEEAREN